MESLLLNAVLLLLVLPFTPCHALASLPINKFNSSRDPDRIRPLDFGLSNANVSKSKMAGTGPSQSGSGPSLPNIDLIIALTAWVRVSPHINYGFPVGGGCQRWAQLEFAFSLMDMGQPVSCEVPCFAQDRLKAAILVPGLVNAVVELITFPAGGKLNGYRAMIDNAFLWYLRPGLKLPYKGRFTCYAIGLAPGANILGTIRARRKDKYGELVTPTDYFQQLENILGPDYTSRQIEKSGSPQELGYIITWKSTPC